MSAEIVNHLERRATSGDEAGIGKALTMRARAQADALLRSSIH
jgi:hypothetical protein